MGEYIFSNKVAEFITNFIGSWLFVFILTGGLAFWYFYNRYSSTPFDPYPYDLLGTLINLFSVFTAPLILISDNIAAKREKNKIDRISALEGQTRKDTNAILEHIKELKKDIKKEA